MSELACPLALLTMCAILVIFVVVTVDGRAARRRLAEVEEENAALRDQLIRERAVFRSSLDTLDRVAVRTGQDVVEKLRAMSSRID